MKVNINDIGGEIIKKDEVYDLRDNKHLKNLVLSSTFLKPGRNTRGHSHAGQEEVYYFVSGRGKMQLGEAEPFTVGAGDVILIEDGVFHKVFNPGPSALYFVCVFDGKRNH